MEKILKFQFSLFGSFVNIQPNLELTNKITNDLSKEEFHPSIVTINRVDTNNKRIITENRLQLVSRNNLWSVVFLQERIDINYTYLGGDNFYTDVKSIFEKGKEICSMVFKSISDTTGNRIAINGKFLLKNMNTSDKQSFNRSISIIPKVYGDNDITECNVHFNSPTNISFGNKNEKCNYIVDIFDFFGIDERKQEVASRIALNVDINTNQNSKEFKYRFTDMLSFADAVCSMFEDAIKEVDGKC